MHRGPVAAPGWRRLSLIVVAVALAAIPAAASAADWPTFHGDNTRQGNDSSDTGLAAPGVAWTSAQLDGQVYGQPVVVGDHVVVATENNTVYSLSAISGAVQWATHVGGPPRTSNFVCGNIRPLGITGTPVIDSGHVYVAAEVQQSPTMFIFDLVSLSLASGAINWTQNIDPPDPQWKTVAQYQQERGALLVTGGRVVVPLGGLFGDCGTYHGYVLSFPESGTGSLTWWASSEKSGVANDKEGSIWAAGGLSEDASGFVYASTGNSNQTTSGSTYDYGDSVIKLNPAALAPGAPVDYFAPSTWVADNAGDVDLGSTTPLQLPNSRVLIVGKSGIGYLLSTASLGHINGQLAQHRVCNASNDAAFGSLAYANGVAYVGCSDGLAAVQINGTSSDFSPLWYNTSTVVDHPPTIAGGLVWSTSPDDNTLRAFTTGGQPVTSFPVSASHFTTPTAANGQLYVAGGTVIHAFHGCVGSPLLGDVSGDGRADLVSDGPGGSCVLASTGTSFTSPTPWSTVPFFGDRATLSAAVGGGTRSDLVAVDSTSTWVLPSTGSAFSAPQQWSISPFFGQRATLAGDLTGNGIADLIAVDDSSTWVMLSNGSTFSAPQPWSGAPFHGTRATLAADVNGDGLVDLVAVDDTATWVMLSNGHGFSAPQPWSTSPFYGSRATLAGDVSGDGRADLVAVDDTATWVMTSNGSGGFSAPHPWHSGAFFGAVATLGGDVNNDSRMDLVAVNAMGTWVMLSTGSAFATPAEWWTGSP